LATKSLPMLEPAPALFSTTNCWPMACDSFWPRMRATTSVKPPGAKGTISLTGRFG
jgi:hypothetical protein